MSIKRLLGILLSTYCISVIPPILFSPLPFWWTALMVLLGTAGVMLGLALGFAAICAIIVGVVTLSEKIKDLREVAVINAFVSKSKKAKENLASLLNSKPESARVDIIKTLAANSKIDAKDLAPLLKYVKGYEVDIVKEFIKTHQATRYDLALFLRKIVVNDGNVNDGKVKGYIVNYFLSQNKEYKLSNAEGKLEIVSQIIKASDLQYNIYAMMTIFREFIPDNDTPVTFLHTVDSSVSNTLRTLYPSTEWDDLKGSIKIKYLIRMIEVAIEKEVFNGPQQWQRSSLLSLPNINGSHQTDRLTPAFFSRAPFDTPFTHRKTPFENTQSQNQKQNLRF